MAGDGTKRLNLSGLQVTKVGKITFSRNLQRLTLDNNFLTEINDLEVNDGLQEMHVRNNSINWENSQDFALRIHLMPPGYYSGFYPSVPAGAFRAAMEAKGWIFKN